METKLDLDAKRYADGSVPKFQRYFRLSSEAKGKYVRRFYRWLYRRECEKKLIEIPLSVHIGEGLFINHPMCITINKDAVLGRNINLHKGVTIGQENRGPRKGCPTISDNVWIGTNATIVGKIHIGSDVLIAPNSLINCDVPDHSVVFGNPCIIKHRENATEGYLNRCI